MSDQPPRAAGTSPPEPIVRGLDAVAARIRLLRTTGGASRLLAWCGVVLVALYVVDRWLHLPLPVRGVALALLAALAVRELGRRVWRPLFRGPGRLDAARLVEQVRPEFEGRLLTALEFGSGGPGSLEEAVARQADAAVRGTDLREVLTPRPALHSLGAAVGVAAAVLALVRLAEPDVGVFVRRWTLHDVDWPRATRLSLQLAQRGPAHVVRDDGLVVVSRGGVLDVEARAEGRRPERVELVVEGEGGERATAMTRLDDAWRGHATLERGDLGVRVRGGDDPGADTERRVRVVDPPRLEAPQFELEPPAYLAQPARTVGAAGLVVDEGTRITVRGRATGPVTEAALWMLGTGESVPLEVVEDGDQPLLAGSWTASSSDSLAAILTGPEGLATPDPAHHTLLVRPDRPPTLRVFAPPRSAVKVTARAVVPFAVVAEDDHGIEEVALRSGRPDAVAPPRSFAADAVRPAHHRLVIDLASEPDAPVAAYTIVAVDGRDLPSRGPQSARVEGRRVEIVETAEVQRLLADRQLRLKEAYQSIRDRQARAIETTDALLEQPPGGDDPDLVAVVVSQNQVTARLARELRELAGVVTETVLNRLDSGPGAAAVLQRCLDDWRARPVDESFSGETWRRLVDDYAAGRFGRLDQVGRLLDMVGLALELGETLSPDAHRLLTEARTAPSPERLAAARTAQLAVDDALGRLLDRMDEWEDYQEVLQLLETLIDDQQRLRSRTEDVLRERETP